METSAFHELLDLLKSQGSEFLPGVAPSEFQQAMRVHSIAPSRDVVELYSLIGGLPEGGAKSLLFFNLWTPERIFTEHAKSPWQYIWFADYLYGSHLYCLRQESNDVSSVHIDHHCDRKATPELISPSLQDFCQRLITDHESVGCYSED